MNELILLENLGYLYPKENSTQKRKFGLYQCFCGNTFKTQIRYVKINHTKSCGCLKGKEHNLSNHRLYGIWYMMIDRCYNSKNSYYKNYGNNNILVCDEWHNIENFINDMYPTFIEGLSIDRINPNGNYEKSNCRWATCEVQSRNTKLLRTDNTSGYRGVSFNKKLNKWSGYINIKGKKKHLGLFENKEDSAKAYDKYVTDNNLEHTKNFN